jgi:hypothetical protein
MNDDSPWVTLPRAAKILGIGTRAIRTLIDRRQLTVRDVPGSYPRVLQSDVERVARETTTQATTA